MWPKEKEDLQRFFFKEINLGEAEISKCSRFGWTLGPAPPNYPKTRTI